ncbi:MAG: single-stranded DNA-binding protein [Verrucomicrobiae bacterium]|nr:single-stranded DNA-binding protein [Verrucomicrobiae bacterium]
MTDEKIKPPSSPQFENNPCSVLQDMLEMLGLEAKVSETPLEDGVLLYIATPEAGRLIGRQGQHLQDLKFLLDRMMHKQYPDTPRKITVDVEHYLEKQNDDMIQKAHEAADKVKRWGDPVELPAMNAYDRQVVHQTLADDPELEAVSVDGRRQDGGRKGIVIRLKPPATNKPSQ